MVVPANGLLNLRRHGTGRGHTRPAIAAANARARQLLDARDGR
jgi:hypothetical protein